MVFTIHAAHAAFLFVGIKRLNLSPGSTNDCLTIALATMRDQGFAQPAPRKRCVGNAGRRLRVGVMRSRAGRQLLLVFVASTGDDENNTRAEFTW